MCVYTSVYIYVCTYVYIYVCIYTSKSLRCLFVKIHTLYDEGHTFLRLIRYIGKNHQYYILQVSEQEMMSVI